MNYFKKVRWTPMNILKAVGIVFVALLVLSIALRLISSTFYSMGFDTYGVGMSAPSFAPMMRDGDFEYADEMVMMTQKAEGGIGGGNVIVPPQPGAGAGADAEDFEVTEYRVTFETLDRDDQCSEIFELKKLDYVIFESADESERGCNYTFKVAHEHVADVLAQLEAMDPRDLTENTYTIKRQLENVTSETEILEKKLASIDATLDSALVAYEQVTSLAVRTQNAESLAKAIDSKINTIDRLTQERLNVAAQLERFARSKQDQLDRLEYTYFSVNVYENKFFDGDEIVDSWKAAVKYFVQDVNEIAQSVTINLVSFLLVLVQYVLYLLIMVFVAKYLWIGIKRVWRM